jgi:hypothetical protein
MLSLSAFACRQAVRCGVCIRLRPLDTVLCGVRLLPGRSLHGHLCRDVLAGILAGTSSEGASFSLFALLTPITPQSTYAATNVLCGTSFTITIMNSVLTGGWESPIHYFLITLPVTSMLLVGWSHAMAWTFIGLAGVCGLYLLEYPSVKLFVFPPVPAAYRPGWQFILELSLFVMIFILIWIYQRLLSLVLDIKDRQALLLQSSLKRRQEFLAHVSFRRLQPEFRLLQLEAHVSQVTHEIRTPVHGMLAMTKMLGNRNLDPSQQQQYIENMQNCGDMLLRLVNNVRLSPIKNTQCDTGFGLVLGGGWLPANESSACAASPAGEQLLQSSERAGQPEVLTAAMRAPIRRRPPGSDSNGRRASAPNFGESYWQRW